MRTRPLIVAILAAALVSTCSKRVPRPKGLAPGTPYVSWVFMSGDRDNPDREFVCESDPRSDCVVPVSRPDAPVFSDVHFYYHSAGAETKYMGTIDIGFFQGSTEAHTTRTNLTVGKNESITNQSVAGIVTATPGTYAVVFDLMATVTDTGTTQPIRQSVQVVVQ
jgi:hypothetical protein